MCLEGSRWGGDRYGKVVVVVVLEERWNGRSERADESGRGVCERRGQM